MKVNQEYAFPPYVHEVVSIDHDQIMCILADVEAEGGPGVLKLEVCMYVWWGGFHNVLRL